MAILLMLTSLHDESIQEHPDDSGLRYGGPCRIEVEVPM